MPDMMTPNAKGKTVADYLPAAAQALGIDLNKLQASQRPMEGARNAGGSCVIGT